MGEQAHEALWFEFCTFFMPGTLGINGLVHGVRPLCREDVGMAAFIVAQDRLDSFTVFVAGWVLRRLLQAIDHRCMITFDRNTDVLTILARVQATLSVSRQSARRRTSPADAVSIC